MTKGEWGSERLKHIADVAFSSVDKKSVEGEIAVRLCNYTDVYYNDEITVDLPLMEATASLDQVRSFGLRAGDVLITKDSETADDIGVPAFVPNTLPGVVSGYHLAVLRPKQDRVDPKYLFWSVSSTPAREQMSVMASGVTRYGLRFADVGNLHFPVPDLDKQRAVANFLDRETARIDSLISMKLQLRKLLIARRRRIANDLIARLAARNGSIPLKRVVRCLDGRRVPLSAEERTNRRGPYPYYGASEVVDWIDGYLFDEALVLLGEDGAQLADPEFPIAQVVSGKIWVNNHAHVLRPTQADPEYLALVLNSVDRMPFLTGATRPKITQDDMGRIPIPHGSIGDQMNVTKELQARTAAGGRVDRLLQEDLQLLAERRQALITAAVTGQLDVRTPAA